MKEKNLSITTMLPIAERLNKSLEIQRVLKKGKRVNSLYFSLYRQSAIDSNLSGRFRAAVIAGLKVSKKATERNRAKRLIQAAIRQFRQNNRIAGDFVFILKSEIIDKDFPTINQEVARCLKIFASVWLKFTRRRFHQITVES